MHGTNKYQARESRAIVRDVLVREWDPIGVNGIPGAEDEYDSYVGKIYLMLIDERASRDAILKYLLDVAINHMGLSPHEFITQRSTRTADLLLSLRPQFETH